MILLLFQYVQIIAKSCLSVGIPSSIKTQKNAIHPLKKTCALNPARLFRILLKFVAIISEIRMNNAIMDDQKAVKPVK